MRGMTESDFWGRLRIEKSMWVSLSTGKCAEKEDKDFSRKTKNH
jgi:hypothetical protein